IYILALAAFAAFVPGGIRFDGLWRWAHLVIWVLMGITLIMLFVTTAALTPARITLAGVIALVVAMLLSLAIPALGNMLGDDGTTPMAVEWDQDFLAQRPQCQ